jgi:hypothetical protein
MSLYFLFKYGLVGFAFIGWIVYQLKVKQKQWNDIKSDALVIALFIIIAGSVFYWLLH